MLKYILAGAVGFGTGYAVCKFTLEVKYEKLAHQEAEEARAYYKERAADLGPKECTGCEVVGAPKDEPAEEVEETFYDKQQREAHENLKRVLSPYQTGVLIPKEELRPVPAPKLPKLPTPRDEEKPFIITDEEFFEGEAGHEAMTFTWYRGDDTLAASNDKVIEGKVRVGLIGEGTENLVFDGEKSEDPCIVYIRSYAATADCEVVLSEGKYSEEVLGL